MKYFRIRLISSLLPLWASLAHATQPFFTFQEVGQTIAEDFNDYRGSEITLPADIFVNWDTGRTSVPFQGVNTGAFTAYTADETDYSFGIRERNPVDLRDSRVFLPIKNETGQDIRYFQVTYDVEAWFIGDRRNRIRLKYDNFLTSAEAGGRSTFETDIFSTDNPSATTTPNTAVDGSLGANRVTVSGIIDLHTLDDGTGNFFPSLADGETAWFRWQFSNAAGDGGSLRSGLAINNLSITVLEDLPDLQWKPGVGGSGIWLPSGGTDWSGGPWEQERNALFADDPGIVTLDGAIEALAVRFSSDYTLAGGTNDSLFAASGLIIDEAVTVFLEARLAEAGGLRKLGAGVLEVGVEQNYMGTTELISGTLRLADDEVLSGSAPLVITPGAVFDLNGYAQTIAGLNGERDGLIDLGDGGNLIIDVPSGSFAYRADLVGDGNVIKRGSGSQRFRSENKTYTGFTRIEEGTLEVTGNGEMTDTSAIEVMPDGELFFVGDSSSGPPAEFGAPISLKGGRLAFQNTGDEALYFVDTEVQILEDGSTVNVSGAESIAIFDAGFGGELTGTAQFRKTGSGLMEIEGNHSHTGGMEVRNGSVLLVSGSSLGAGPLRFTTSDVRSLELQNSGLTVSLLDGSATDPEEEDAENNLTLTIGSGATLTVDQSILLDEEDEEISTRFQGVIQGAGNFIKSGDGFLRLTRWAKTYTGSTTIQQGVLAVSESAALANTSGITVQDGGQLRLTTSGEHVFYQFGGDLSLAGAGRSGGVTEGSGQGILGALRYHPGNNDNIATLANAIVFDSGNGVTTHVNGSSNTLILDGTLTGGGVDPITKSGGGTLVLAAANAALSKPWEIANGTLHLQAGASTGNGAVAVGVNGILSGPGLVAGDAQISGALVIPAAADAISVSGDLGVLAGGRLLVNPFERDPETPGLIIDGALAFAPDALLQVSGDPQAGSYHLVTALGDITGVDNLGVAGLEDSGFTGLISQQGDQLLLILTSTETENFSDWIDQFGLPESMRGPLANPAGDGLSNLLKYALGADPLVPVSRADLYHVGAEDDEHGNIYPVIYAVVRNDDPDLQIDATGSRDLTVWNLDTIALEGVSQSGVAAGFQRRGWRLDENANEIPGFLRLEINLTD